MKSDRQLALNLQESVNKFETVLVNAEDDIQHLALSYQRRLNERTGPGLSAVRNGDSREEAGKAKGLRGIKEAPEE